MIALYPGSFDPVTVGHMDIITRAASLFERVVVGVFHNPDKPSGAFPLKERLSLLEIAAGHLANVSFRAFSGLAVEGARACDADVIIRGIRTADDIALEVQMAQLNRALSGIETALLPAAPQFVHISAGMVRQIGCLGGDLTGLVPEKVRPLVLQRLYKANKEGVQDDGV